MSNVGLFLNVAAVLAFAIGLAGLGSHASLAAAGTVAFSALLFLASLVCFAVGGRRLDAARPARRQSRVRRLGRHIGGPEQRATRMTFPARRRFTKRLAANDIFVCESAAAAGRRTDPEDSRRMRVDGRDVAVSGQPAAAADPPHQRHPAPGRRRGVPGGGDHQLGDHAQRLGGPGEVDLRHRRRADPTQSNLVYLAYGIAILALPFAILIGLLAARQWKMLLAYAAAG